ncbi:glucose-6-phosphate dehydrogenase assembly protein OpcA [Ruaniaceae bacterium KH17]|nr:glucose-6-phosphate dehydrogenase assembly protein OpcA [Ruaniaceae bacterium KH17]
MIIPLESCTAAQVANRLNEVREEGGVVALGRVLTLIVMTDHGGVEDAIELANNASREHPARVIVIEDCRNSADDGLDAEIRVGADAGASEVVVLKPRGDAGRELDTLITPLLLPDTPIVALWLGDTPANPAASLIGQMATRRITEAVNNGLPALRELATHYQPGDTDLSWARITLWRALLAAQFDQPLPTPVSVTITGNSERPATHLLAGWLRDRLNVPVEIAPIEAVELRTVRVDFENDHLVIDREPGSATATISRPGGIAQSTSLAVRTLGDCLMEDLRRLDADVTYAAALAAAALAEV